MWTWLERKIFRRLEMRLAAEAFGNFARIERAVAEQRRELLVAIAQLKADTERLVGEAVIFGRQAAQILAFAQTAADVTRATIAADHAARLEQLATSVSQVIALQFGKTPNTITVLPSRPPREFDSERRQ